MTVSSDVNKITYAGNGSTQVFSVNYYFLADSHLQVVLITTAGVETVQTLTTNYTVTGAGNEAGGSITMLVSPPTGVSVVIQRVVPATQETDYLANDPFPAESHERALDKLTMLVQQNERENDRSLKIPLSAVPTTSTELPAPVGNKLLAWNSNASAVINFDPADIITIVGQQTSYGDVFTGNGVTTDFALTRSPGSVFGIDVSINGVTQVPNVDYTLGGTTLTFTSAPPAAASQILARYAEVYTSYDADAQDVRYLPAGTGAVTTNVQTKLRETVSVKDFGAVGDGVADDTSAIQAAIDYAYTFIITQTVFDDYGWQSRGGMTVVLPQGKYLTTSTVTIRPNVSLKGEGKSSSAIYSTYDGVILDVAPATKSGEYGKAGITLQDFMIIGDRALTTSQVGVDLLRAVGMKIIGMVINSCSAEGMILRETSNSTIIDLEIANCGGCGLMLMEGTTGYPCNANTFISPRILYNDGDGIIIADEANGNTFIGGSVERNGYATNGVGFYNIKVTSPSYVPNHFIDLWTEGPCDAHIYMNSGVSGIGTQLRLTGWKHFGDGALNSPDRALIVDSGFAKVVESTASAVSYKIINGSNSPFRVNKAGGAAIIYLENPTGATISVPTDWIEDENGNHTQLFNIALIDAPEFSLGSKSFITDAQAGDGVAYKNDAETYPWYQSRAFQKDVLIGTGSVAASSGISAGVGSPEGNKTASQGSIYMNMNGGAGVSFYVKESGTGNTGWVAK